MLFPLDLFSSNAGLLASDEAQQISAGDQLLFSLRQVKGLELMQSPFHPLFALPRAECIVRGEDDMFRSIKLVAAFKGVDRSIENRIAVESPEI